MMRVCVDIFQKFPQQPGARCGLFLAESLLRTPFVRYESITSSYVRSDVSADSDSTMLPRSSDTIEALDFLPPRFDSRSLVVRYAA